MPENLTLEPGTKTISTTSQPDSTELSNPELKEFAEVKKEIVSNQTVAGNNQTPAGNDPPPERPVWLPENFKTPEDLAKSYKEQQAEFTRRSQELAEIKREAESLKIDRINTIAQNAEVVLMNDLKLLDAALTRGELSQSEYEFTKQSAIKSYEQYVEQLKNYKPQVQQAQQQPPDITQYVEKYGQPVDIDEFAAKNKDFLNQPYKQDIFNGLKTLYGGQLGNKELEAIKNMIEVVEKGTEARVKNELAVQNQQVEIKAKMNSAINTMPPNSGSVKIWTRDEIGKLSIEDFNKYESEISSQVSKGLVK